MSTTKRSYLAIKDSNNKLELSEKNTFFVNGFGFTPQNIYITSDEEIKEGYWVFDSTNYGLIHKVWEVTKTHFSFKDSLHARGLKSRNRNLKIHFKKIILTTDQDLIKDGVQAIDDEFLEWFVKNPSCESVEVKKRYSDFTVDPFVGYKIIIPKEEITIINGGDDIVFPSSTTITFKSLPDVNWESDITNKVWDEDEPKQIKCYCGHTITCDCEPLQETIEEFINQSNTPEGLDQFSYDKGLEDGAKWQSKRMYSDKEVELLLHRFMQSQHPDWHGYSTTKWFEQNKKKFG
jgi:hypothetical protein